MNIKLLPILNSKNFSSAQIINTEVSVNINSHFNIRPKQSLRTRHLPLEQVSLHRCHIDINPLKHYPAVCLLWATTYSQSIQDALDIGAALLSRISILEIEIAESLSITNLPVFN